MIRMKGMTSTFRADALVALLAFVTLPMLAVNGLVSREALAQVQDDLMTCTGDASASDFGPNRLNRVM